MLPLVCCAAAFIAALNEPIYDILGKIVYATDNPMAYEAFGRRVPWFLVLGYIPWVGLGPYAVYRAMKAGVPRRTLHLAGLALVGSVMAVEIFGNTLNVWTYYGEAPMKYLGVAPQAMTYPLVGGMLLLILVENVEGRRRYVRGFFIALIVLPIGYAATSWPIYFALYADLPPVVDWLTVAAQVVLIAAMAGGATFLAERWLSLQALAGADLTSSAPHPASTEATEGLGL